MHYGHQMFFMERVEQNADWSFFCPNECPGLQDAYGEEFKKLYEYMKHKDLPERPYLLEPYGTR